MHCDHDIFVRAINEKRKVILNYLNDEHKLNFAKLCVLLYYRPSRIKRSEFECYYLWDLEDIAGKHFLRLPPSQIVSMELTEETFDPEMFIPLANGIRESLDENKARQDDAHSTVDSKESIPTEPMPEKDSEIAKLAKRLVDKIRETGPFEGKEPAEDSNNTVGLNANTEKEN